MESEYIARKTKLVEYIKLHVISLEQDLENISSEMEELDPESNHWSGQLLATRHILSVVEDIL
jgi:hypothetical protein